MWRRTAGWNVLLCLLLVPAGILAQNVSQGRHRPPHDLVEVVTLDSTIALDIRYATDHNFMGRVMYSQARAFLQRPVAEALVRVHRRLRSQGYGIVILDAYRPWSITKKFWEETPPAKRDYVANPNTGSRHNRGAAVDVTLYDLSTGREVSMPSAYDEFSERGQPMLGVRRSSEGCGICFGSAWNGRDSGSIPASGGTSHINSGVSTRFSTFRLNSWTDSFLSFISPAQEAP
jgi:D-alanyl-D-alanine dipeptidase